MARITAKTPLFLLPAPAPVQPRPGGWNDTVVPADAELFLMCPHPCRLHTGERIRLENKELLYTSLQLSDTAAMQQKLATLETRRTTLQASPVADGDGLTNPIELEDETVDDDPTVVEDGAGDPPVQPDDVIIEDVVPSEEDEADPVSAPQVVPEFVPLPSEPASSSVVVAPDPPAATVRPPPTVLLSEVRVPPVSMPPPAPSETGTGVGNPPPIEMRLGFEPSEVDDRSTIPLDWPPQPPPHTTVPSAPPSEPAPTGAPEDPPPPAPRPPLPDTDSTERQTLLRQLDLLRVKFKQSVIPPDIEAYPTASVRSVVERNLVRPGTPVCRCVRPHLKRARNVMQADRVRGTRPPGFRHVQAGSGRLPGGIGISPGTPDAARYVPFLGLA